MLAEIERKKRMKVQLFWQQQNSIVSFELVGRRRFQMMTMLLRITVKSLALMTMQMQMTEVS
jgi:hypothetical protein